MNKGSDKQFQNRWNFRRREDDADSSSDDSKSKSTGEAEDRKRELLSHLAVPENFEVLASPRFQQDNKLDHDKDVHLLSEKTAKKRVKPTKKKKKNLQLEQTKKTPTGEKKTRRRKVKEIQLEQKTTRRRNTNIREKKMSEDLKIFTNSLVQELKVARENMFAQMKEEMRKMIACRSSSGPRTDRFNGNVGGCHKSNVDLKTPIANELSSMLPNESIHGVSSPYLTLPTVVMKRQPQSNIVLSNDCICEAAPKINASSDVDIRKLMNSKNHDGFPAFHPTETQLGSCSQFSCKSSGQNLSQMTSVGLGFPVPGLHEVMDKGSDMSSLTEDCRLGPRMKGNVVNFLEGNPAFLRMQLNRRA